MYDNKTYEIVSFLVATEAGFSWGTQLLEEQVDILISDFRELLGRSGSFAAPLHQLR